MAHISSANRNLSRKLCEQSHALQKAAAIRTVADSKGASARSLRLQAGHRAAKVPEPYIVRHGYGIPRLTPVPGN